MKFNYYILKKIIPILTPSFKKKLKELEMKGILKDLQYVSDTPRPITKFMKKYFLKKKLVGVEIGVWKGKNTKSILKELNIELLYLIDIWKNYNNYFRFEKNNDKYYNKIVNKYKNNPKVIIIRNYSEIAVKEFKDNSLDFVYIDGNHHYNFIYNDINNWFKKVRFKGILSGHDISNFKDVLKALKDWSYLNNKKYVIIEPDWYIIKNKRDD